MLPEVPARPDPVFARIKALVIGRTLHHYYQDKDTLLRERVQRRLQAVALDEAGYLRLLQGGVGSEAEWTALEAEITIGETFFFRYAEQFAALADTILPTLIRARAGSRSLRIWSAGCASGAEPYSVAILLHRLLGQRLADWTISILGTDISDAALTAAREATYGDWALRSLSEAERRRDFLPLPDSGGRRWTLRPAYRAMVRFERQNLLGLLDGAAPFHRGYDLVLCRNVLIYFHADRVQALVQRFGESLAADGWLLLGHAEAASFETAGVRPVPLDGTVAWMREGPAAPQAVVSAPLKLRGRAVEPRRAPRPAMVGSAASMPDASAASTPGMVARPAPEASARPAPEASAHPAPEASAHPAPEASVNPAQEASAQGAREVITPSGPEARSLFGPERSAASGPGAPVARASEASIAAVPLPDGAEAAAVERVRARADSGEPHAALLLCRQMLSLHPVSAPLFFYAGVLQRTLGNEDAAEADFRRAIYLCNHFAMAHYHLGLLLTDAGRLLPGRRAIAEAGRIARLLPDDEALACGDGMTAARMRSLARLDWLPAAQAST